MGVGEPCAEPDWLGSPGAEAAGVLPSVSPEAASDPAIPTSVGN
jgi:hypothetical protein